MTRRIEPSDHYGSERVPAGAVDRLLDREDAARRLDLQILWALTRGDWAEWERLRRERAAL